MLDRRGDPVGADEIWRAKYEAACAEFRARQITEAVFRAKLIGLGYHGDRLRAEVNLQWPEGGPKEARA